MRKVNPLSLRLQFDYCLSECEVLRTLFSLRQLHFGKIKLSKTRSHKTKPIFNLSIQYPYLFFNLNKVPLLSCKSSKVKANIRKAFD